MGLLNVYYKVLWSLQASGISGDLMLSLVQRGGVKAGWTSFLDGPLVKLNKNYLTSLSE